MLATGTLGPLWQTLDPDCRIRLSECNALGLLQTFVSLYVLAGLQSVNVF